VAAGVIAGASVSSLTSSDVGIVAVGVKSGDSVVWLPSSDVGVVAAGVEFGVFCCVHVELFPVVDVVATVVDTGAAVVSSGTDVGDRLSGAARILGLTTCLTSCSECIPHNSLGQLVDFGRNFGHLPKCFERF
jgi:hypothetical protein